MEHDDNEFLVPPRVTRRPGRPGTESLAKEETRDTILDSAEQLFSQLGYTTTSFRDIAVDANVNPGLISYYFGSKRALYEAVYKRRGKNLTDRWSEMLDALEERSDQPPTVAEILRVYLSAQFEMKQKGPGGVAFFRLQTRLHSEPQKEAFMLRRDVYDSVGRRFVSLLERALPGVETADISWRFIFIIGVGLYMTSDVDRLNDLSSGRFDSNHLDEALERMMTFCTVGMMAPSTELKVRKAPRKQKTAKAAALPNLGSRARVK
ncbi:TetR/AcrR family transcriptional regulator [Glaciimonas sp. PCH181]|uniref:TetR/AcrR family transcriptional regulator n=1 Tax=Glaciimonas sp. PCH181 TaxID=2133943 RepID=UPI000D3889FA|nr:TetR/AcrR family transcriptional regulator [Glaciimonas sp. PCH181]PUA19689.1 TetR/AcrR family transcriptional regulator [Glaciimonas sp. PCH181]